MAGEVYRWLAPILAVRQHRLRPSVRRPLEVSDLERFAALVSAKLDA
jgi:hypothetical protein